MIYYRPTDGDVHGAQIGWRPRTCFVMSQLARPFPPQLEAALGRLRKLGWMQAYGRETVVVKIGDVRLPSDLVRTEYIEYDKHFSRRFRRFLESLESRASYYATTSQQLQKNPLLAIDYLRRAYLLTADGALREQARVVFEAAGLGDRAPDSVERHLCTF